MDISRIEAYNPSRIDWKRLTAKEIMQYENRGVEVPDVYLQWAHDFLNTVEAQRNDQVTYENAEAQARNQTAEKAQKSNGELVPEDGGSIDGSVEGDNNDEVVPQVSMGNAELKVNAGPETSSKVEDKPLSAAEVREKMKKDGADTVSIAIAFKGYSDANSAESAASSEVSNNIQAASANSIEELESNMQDLMSKIEEAQNEIKNLAPRANDQSAIAQINRLQAEIDSYTQSGISELTGAGETFNEYDSTLAQQEGIGETAQEYGTETVAAGQEVQDYIFYNAFGRNVISSGKKAISEGENALNMRNNALGTNQDSQSRLNALESEMQSRTGIKVANTAETEENNEENNNLEKQANESQQKPESEKDIKASQNDGTDNTDKANTDVNEIIKRKIRRGENMG